MCDSESTCAQIVIFVWESFALCILSSSFREGRMAWNLPMEVTMREFWCTLTCIHEFMFLRKITVPLMTGVFLTTVGFKPLYFGPFCWHDLVPSQIKSSKKANSGFIRNLSCGMVGKSKYPSINVLNKGEKVFKHDKKIWTSGKLFFFWVQRL